ncbi:amidohydrolase [Anatilimnocola sp. NA78]|uniref:amidohydrolase family protein n=1 Tax=Anatilimnocola sp. NA78 TaxID=3415683 RepID=UPI003CE58093
MPHATELPLLRRSLLQASLAAVAVSTTVRSVAAAAPPPLSEIVDCHTHFYDPERKEGVPWPSKQDKVLYRSVLPTEFQQLTKPLGITGTIVVEASPWVEDNQWLLDLADRNPFIVGVIGNLKPGTPDFVKHVERFADNERFRGIRVNVGDLKAGLDQPDYVNDLRVLSAAKLTLDVNGGPDTPARVARLAEMLPRLRIVINHCGNLKIDGQPPPAEWLAGMQAAVRHQRVYCKVSALVEATGKRDGDAPLSGDFYKPVLDALWKTWGDRRLIYGSNWPVSTRAASYGDLLQIVRDYVSRHRPAAERDYFFLHNSVAAYRWKTR